MHAVTNFKQAPKHLWFLILTYSMTLAISNWYDARLINLFGLIITPGTLLFPITFLLSDIITEVYGYKNARRAIWVSLLFNIFFISYGKFLTILPCPPNFTNYEIDKLINLNTWIIIGSFTSYVIAEPLNAYIVAKLKVKTNGRYVGARFITSTIIASSIDTPIFVIIAFHNTTNFNSLLTLIYPILLIKCLIEIALLPFSIKCTQLLKQKEQINIFDRNTNFTPFSLNVEY